MRFLTAFLMLLAIPHYVAAQAPAQGQEYANKQLEDEKQEAAATALMFDLRCVQCQGQSIADSDAPIALAMRHEVRSRIKAGESPDDIRAFFISRYGDYITFEPEARGGGLLLWLAPWVLLAIGLFAALRLFRRGKA